MRPLPAQLPRPPAFPSRGSCTGVLAVQPTPAQEQEARRIRTMNGDDGGGTDEAELQVLVVEVEMEVLRTEVMVVH